MEIEAKYSVADPAVFAALLELQALGDYTLRPVGSRDVIDHYLDTPDRDLLRGGYACRLREGEKDGRWLVTVKELGKAAGAVHQREEHECEIPPHAPPAEWPEGPAREIVMRLSGEEPLVELFTLRQHRDLRAVEQDGRAAAELSLDTVEMHIGSRTSVTHEMEIELEAGGTMDDLHAIAAALEPYRLKAQSKSKFERALAKLDHARTGPAGKKKKGPGARPDEPLAEAGRKILRFHYDRMAANEDDTREGKDIEALHHMRVATRRQRAAFRIVAPYFRRKAIRAFRDELRIAAGYLGAVRDLDVLIEAAEKHQSSLSSPGAEGLEPLLDEWRGKRDAAREDLLAYLDGDDYQAFKESYSAFLSSTGEGLKDAAPDDAPAPHLVRHILPAEMWDHYGRVRAYETVLAWASIFQRGAGARRPRGHRGARRPAGSHGRVARRGRHDRASASFPDPQPAGFGQSGGGQLREGVSQAPTGPAAHAAAHAEAAVAAGGREALSRPPRPIHGGPLAGRLRDRA